MKQHPHKKPELILLWLMAVMSLLLNSCSSNSSGNSSSNGSIDPWNPPVGELVAGASLSEGWTDLRVLPAPVNIDGGWTDSVAASPDGLSLYFGYSRIDFSQFRDSSGATINYSGPLRAGMTGDMFKMFKATLSKSGWTVSFLPFNGNPNTHELAASTNQDQDIVVFTQWINNLGDIYFVTKTGNTWSIPNSVPSTEINSICSDVNPFIVGNLTSGLRLYFESNRSNDAGTVCGNAVHIYYSDYSSVSGIFGAVQKVPGINGTNTAVDNDYQPFFTADKKRAYWTAVRSNAYGVFTAELVGDAYMNPRPIIQPNFVQPFTGKLALIGEANVVELPQGWLMYMMCGIATSEENGQPKNIKLHVCVAKKPKTAAIEAAKKINTAGWSDSPFISRDGQRLYFMYSRWDFSTWILSGGTLAPTLAGPDRPGLNKNDTNGWDESDIYMATKNPDGSWSEPVNLGLNGAYGDASGMEIDNGNTFLWLSGHGTGNNIVMATKNSDGTWDSIVDPGSEINQTGVIQDNPHISADGNAMWFVSSRTGGTGGKDLWFSSNSGGVWSTPVNAGSPFNTAGDEDQPWISPVSQDVYWNGPSGIMHCVSNDTTCTGTPDIVAIPGCPYAAEVSMPDDMQTLYFGCGDITTGRVKIMYSQKQGDGSWGTATPVD